MKKYILLSIALFSFVSVQNTFADYNFKDWEKVEVSWYFLSSALDGECGGGASFSAVGRAWENQGQYAEFLKSISQIWCGASHSIGILSNAKNTPVGFEKYKIDSKYEDIEAVTKTVSGDFLLLPGKNLQKNLSSNPIFLKWMKTSGATKGVEIQMFLRYLDANESYDYSLKQSIDSNKEINPIRHITMKGIYFNPKGSFLFSSPKSSGNIDTDLKIIIVDDIEIVKTEIVKYKYLNDKIIAVLDRKINNLILYNTDKDEKTILNSLTKSVDKIILNSTWKKKEAYIEVNLFLKEKLDKLNKSDEPNLEFLFQN
ncbi:MAG: hypothetical protein ACD_49C00083G0011 [uncultured bacterium (gcode 4)]|uniref:Uncharacterized protein n=1 Tax=uncultured bacterium (gcode 4) TaxID=1234023 RepID=K2BUB3_9BACT|nr:MAG: hypothetical protein ACD_49C00083G0011 [uncultured bacterium (gcode 4)]